MSKFQLNSAGESSQLSWFNVFCLIKVYYWQLSIDRCFFNFYRKIFLFIFSIFDTLTIFWILKVTIFTLVRAIKWCFIHFGALKNEKFWEVLSFDWCLLILFTEKSLLTDYSDRAKEFAALQKHSKQNGQIYIFVNWEVINFCCYLSTIFSLNLQK